MVNIGDAVGFQYDMKHDFWREGVDSLSVKRMEKIFCSYKNYGSMGNHRGWAANACVDDWGSKSGGRG